MLLPPAHAVQNFLDIVLAPRRLAGSAYPCEAQPGPGS